MNGLSDGVAADAGPGFEGSNCGRLINYTRTIGFEYRTVCGDRLRVLTWDHTKSLQTGYGRSYRDVVVTS